MFVQPKSEDRKTSPADPDARRREMAVRAAQTAGENRGRDVVVLDVRRLTPMFDYFVIATGTSNRQLHAMADEIDRVLSKKLGSQRLGIEGYDRGGWILLDFGEVVVHLFDESTRAYYDLENLWCDAERVAVDVVSSE